MRTIQVYGKIDKIPVEKVLAKILRQELYTKSIFSGANHTCQPFLKALISEKQWTALLNLSDATNNPCVTI
jgi:hypothetical protein